MSRQHVLALLLPALACSPSEVTITGPAEVTVFAGGSVAVPVALQWVGEPRALSLSGTSGTGLTVASTEVTAGSEQASLTVSATADATAGSLQLTGTGEGVHSELLLPVTVATAELISSSSEPLLRGGHAVAVVAVFGATPTFEGVSAAESLGDGQWRVRVPVPTEAAPGDVTLGFTVRAGDATSALQLAVTVVSGVTVTLRDRAGAPVVGHRVFVNDLAPVVTDAAGQAHFSPVVAPYRLAAARTLNNTQASIFEGATLANPVVAVYASQLPQQSATLSVRLEREASGQLLTGHTHAAVYVMIDGQPREGAFTFTPGGNQNTDEVRWLGTHTEQWVRLRAVAREGSALAWMADVSRTLSASQVEPYEVNFRMYPPRFGVIHTALEIPAGYSVDGKLLTAVFAGNRFDQLPLASDNTPDLDSELTYALDQDDVGHTVSATASDLAGRITTRTWVGLAVGDTAQGALKTPPQLSAPTGEEINDRTEHTWGGTSWPVYRLIRNVGTGPDYRQEVVYTSRQSFVRAPAVDFIPGLSSSSELCGSDFVGSVDELLVDDRTFNESVVHPGSSACDVRRTVTYTGP